MRRTIAALVVLGGLGLAPANAGAVEVLGATAFAGSCSDNMSYVQGNQSVGPDYVANAPGLITSYAMSASGAASEPVGLRVYAPAGGGQFTVRQKDEVRTVAQGNSVVRSFTDLHIPVATGEVVGLFVPDQADNAGACVASTGNPSDSLLSRGGDPEFGVPSLFTALGGNLRLNLQVLVEPDADGDSFGDETQDNCRGQAGTISGCPPATSPPPPTPTKPKCKRKKGKRAAAAARKGCKRKKK